MKTVHAELRVWVGCLACYNEGRLVGEWVEAQDALEFIPCGTPGHEEFECFDTDGFGDIGCLTELSPDEAVLIAQKVYEIEDAGVSFEILCAYLDATDENILEIEGSYIEEAYSGSYGSDEEFAQELAAELGLINEDLQWPYTCIDWAQASRELMYDYTESNGHYFRNL